MLLVCLNTFPQILTRGSGVYRSLRIDTGYNSDIDGSELNYARSITGSHCNCSLSFPHTFTVNLLVSHRSRESYSASTTALTDCPTFQHLLTPSHNVKFGCLPRDIHRRTRVFRPSPRRLAAANRDMRKCN